MNKNNLIAILFLVSSLFISTLTYSSDLIAGDDFERWAGAIPKHIIAPTSLVAYNWQVILNKNVKGFACFRTDGSYFSSAQGAEILDGTAAFVRVFSGIPKDKKLKIAFIYRFWNVTRDGLPNGNVILSVDTKAQTTEIKSNSMISLDINTKDSDLWGSWQEKTIEFVSLDEKISVWIIIVGLGYQGIELDIDSVSVYRIE